MTDDTAPRSFPGSIDICFRKSFTFQGRAPRTELWYFVLFAVLVSIVVGVAVGVLTFAVGINVLWVRFLVDLVMLPASVSVQVRRLHDLDRSGWWWWLFLIPVVGAIILLVWNCSRGTEGPNRFGPPVVVYD